MHVVSPEEEEKEGYSGKDLQKRKVLSLEWKSEGAKELGMLIPWKSHSRVESRNSRVSIETERQVTIILLTIGTCCRVVASLDSSEVEKFLSRDREKRSRLEALLSR